MRPSFKMHQISPPTTSSNTLIHVLRVELIAAVTADLPVWPPLWFLFRPFLLLFSFLAAFHTVFLPLHYHSEIPHLGSLQASCTGTPDVIS